MTAEFRRAPDDESEPPAAPSTCGLCGSMVPAGADRCPDCRMAAGFGPGEPSAFSHAVVWSLVAALVAVYLVTLGLVALVR